MFKDKRGHLVLIGGAEDKRDKKEILRKTIALNEAKSVAVIPTASSYPYELGEKYTKAFREIGVEILNVLDVRYREEANRKKYLDFLLDADLIFFTGGDQVKLVETMKNTELLIRIWQKFYNGATIAGTSAGAAAASNPMIFEGDYCGLSKDCVRHAEGFGFVKDVTIDTHFVERCRIPRLTQFLASGKSKKGIGLSEDTAIIIYPDDRFEVIGSGVVTVLNGEKMITDYHHTDRDDQITVDGMKIGFLSKGAQFNLKNWKMILDVDIPEESKLKKLKKIKLSIDKYLNIL